jgi:Ca2+-binding EF-hand superfamily protein
MKKLIGIFLVLLTLPSMAADLELRVAAASNGRIDDHTLDLSAVAAGDKITLELVLSNLDFTLAGFEGEIQFPTSLMVVDVNAVGTGTPPYTSSLVSVQKLPANAAGEDTATTFVNGEGWARVGGVITNPADRPTSGTHVLATFCLVVGRDYDTSANARSLPTCISADEVIRFLGCSTGAANCEIIANDAAEAQSVTYTQADLTIDTTNPDTTFIKGDANNNGFLTTQDVGTSLQCIFFGDNSTNANCPLLVGDPDNKWEIILDANCNGSVTTQDISSILRRAIGTNNRGASSNKNLSYTDLASEGKLDFAGGDNAAATVGVTLQVTGRVDFAEPQISDAGVKDGWQIVGKHMLNTNTYRYIMLNMNGENNVIPSVSLPYTSKNGAKVAVMDVETFAVDGKQVRHEPALNRLDLRDE